MMLMRKNMMAGLPLKRGRFAVHSVNPSMGQYGCSVCSARGVCSIAGYGFTRCRRAPVIQSTQLEYADEGTTVHVPCLTLPSDRFILDVIQVIDATIVLPIGLMETNGTEVIPVYDRHGNYVRTDSLAQTILARARGIYPCVESSISRFHAVYGNDPVRINILDMLAPSSYPSTLGSTYMPSSTSCCGENTSGSSSSSDSGTGSTDSGSGTSTETPSDTPTDTGTDSTAPTETTEPSKTTSGTAKASASTPTNTANTTKAASTSSTFKKLEL